jgi:3-oxoacyl-(acyl-carrier-protein) synthase
MLTNRCVVSKAHVGLAAAAQEEPIDEVADINVVPNAKQQHDINVGISNSFGFGGHNSVVAFGAYKA